MKFRVRYERKTALLTLQENGQVNLGLVKAKIIECLRGELQLPQNFDITLDGKNSLGGDNTLISNVGIVSGDLLKLVATERTSPQAQSSVEDMITNEEPSTSSTPMAPVEDEQERSHSNELTASVPVWNTPPLLLQDCKENVPLPRTLQQMYSSNRVKSDFHAACIALHYLMLECGFVLENPASGLEDAIHGNILAVDYSHPSTEGLLFSMTCNPLGQFLLVNGVVKPCEHTEEQVISLQIKSSDFVKKFNSSTKPEDEKQVYSNLSKLSHTFKENIAHKAINTMREELQLPPLHGILSLFPDLLKRIVSYLGYKELCALSQTCTTFAQIGSDDQLWMTLYMQDFRSAPINPGNRPIKEIYKQNYLRKKEEARRRLDHEREIPFYEPPSPFVGVPVPDMPEPFPGQPPGIIGGDYDVNPSFPYGPFANPRPLPVRPVRPGHPGSANPFPGARFDPINPFGGRFRPGRGGGMMDDFMGPSPRQRRPPRGDFGGFGGFM